MDIVSTNMAIDSDDQKVKYEMDCLIQHTILISNHITIYNWYYLLSLCKRYCHTKNIKIEINQFKKVSIKNCTCYYFDGIIKIEDFNFDDILVNGKSHENILIYDISRKNLICGKTLCMRFYKKNWFIRVYDGTKYLTLFGSEKIYAI